MERHSRSLKKRGKVAGLLEKLRMLHGGAAPAPPGGSLAQVRETTELFERYDHHAVPFSRHALQLAWRSCATDARDAERCEREARSLFLMFGPLGEEVTAEGLDPAG